MLREGEKFRIPAFTPQPCIHKGAESDLDILLSSSPACPENFKPVMKSNHHLATTNYYITMVLNIHRTAVYKLGNL